MNLEPPWEFVEAFGAITFVVAGVDGEPPLLPVVIGMPGCAWPQSGPPLRPFEAALWDAAQQCYRRGDIYRSLEEAQAATFALWRLDN